MGNLLEVLDKISKEVSEETIKKMVNLNDFYKLCVDYGYSSTQDIFKIEYKDILEKSINSLTKSALTDDELDAVSGGSSSRFKSGIALILASIGTLSPSIGATSQKSSSILSNQSSISEKISEYAKSGKEYVSSGLNYLKNGTESLLGKGKEGFNKGLDYASKYGSKLVEYGSDSAKQTLDFIKTHPVESSVIGTSSAGIISTGAILINKFSSNNSEKSKLTTLSSSESGKINDKNQKNSSSVENRFSNIVKFIRLVSPKSVNGRNTYAFVKLTPNEQKETIRLCLKDLGIDQKLVLEILSTNDLITSSIKALYVSISSILRSNSKNQDPLNDLKSIQDHLFELAKLYNIQLGSAQEPKSTVNVTVNLDGVPIEVTADKKPVAGDFVKVLVNGKIVPRKVDENMNVILTENDLRKAEELKKTEALKAEINIELTNKEKSDADKYLKRHGTHVAESEKKLSDIGNKIDELDKEISKTDILLENHKNELNSLERELKQAEDNYKNAKAIPIKGMVDREKVVQLHKISSLNGIVREYQDRISEIKTEIEKNERKSDHAKTQRNKLLGEKTKIDNDNTIKQYYKYKETIKSIDNGTYKVDEAKFKKKFEEKTKVKKDVSLREVRDDIVAEIGKIEMRGGNFDDEDHVTEQEEEWEQ